MCVCTHIYAHCTDHHETQLWKIGHFLKTTCSVTIVEICKQIERPKKTIWRMRKRIWRMCRRNVDTPYADLVHCKFCLCLSVGDVAVAEASREISGIKAVCRFVTKSAKRFRISPVVVFNLHWNVTRKGSTVTVSPQQFSWRDSRNMHARTVEKKKEIS